MASQKEATKDHIHETFEHQVLVGRKQVEYNRKLLANQKANDERSLRFQEGQLIRNFQQAMEVRDYETNLAYAAYNQSVLRSDAQKEFNAIAEAAAREQQAVKFHEDMLGLAFDKGKSVIDYIGNSTGLKVDRHNALVQADLKEAEAKNRFEFGIGRASNDRRKARSQSQINTQQVILEGMKAAGAMKAKGGAGRSAVKTVLGVMAESGAMRAGIANALMYAENSIDLNIAQLKDLQILDQTMVTAARDSAHMTHDVGMEVLDSAKALDNLMFDATEKSIKRRNKLVQKQITNSRRQADLIADSQVLLEPMRTPEPWNPYLDALYAGNDNPETTDYIELLPRATYVDIPDFIPPPKTPDAMIPDDQKKSSGFGFGDVLGAVGTVAGLVGTAGAALIPASGGASALFGMTASQAGWFNLAGGALATAGRYFE